MDIYAESPMTPFVRTQNGIVEFIIKVDKNHEISHILKSLLIDSGLLSRHVVARREGDRYRANLKLPREGEYVIKFYIGQSEDNTGQSGNGRHGSFGSIQSIMYVHNKEKVFVFEKSHPYTSN
jgi:hypothetical protein